MTPDIKDYILVFPTDSGIQPLYVVFKKTERDESGVVTGHGEDITGIWLEEASKGFGAPVPKEIANKLRGREFANFKKFREAFWKEVYANEELRKQFTLSNQREISRGNSPFTLKLECAGKRERFEIHHIEELQHGGALLHINNLRVNTPRNHIKIHSSKKGNK